MGRAKLIWDARDEAIIQSFDKIATRMEKMSRKVDTIGRKSKRAGKSVETSSKAIDSNVAGMILKFASVSAAVGLVTTGLKTWAQNLREITTAAGGAADAVVALAALQEGGTRAKRVQEATQLLVQYGVRQFGEGYGLVQGMQSILGDWEAGKALAEQIMLASHAGLPVEVAKEVAILGILQGRDPVQSMRREFVSGEAVARDPAMIGLAAPALAEFADPDFGYAVAGILAGTRQKRVEVFTRQAGIGLQKPRLSEIPFFQEQVITPGFPAGFERWMLGGQQDALRALHEAGVRTTEQLAFMGWGELRQRSAISDLLINYHARMVEGKKVPGLMNVLETIKREAVPGLFGAKVTGVETELPTVKLARDLDRLTAAHKAELSGFAGPRSEQRATAAQQIMKVDRARGLALRRAGIEQTMLGMNAIDEQGNLTWAARAGMYFWGPPERRAYGRYGIEFEKIKQEFDLPAGAEADPWPALHDWGVLWQWLRGGPQAAEQRPSWFQRAAAENRETWRANLLRLIGEPVGTPPATLSEEFVGPPAPAQQKVSLINASAMPLYHVPRHMVIGTT